MQKNKNVITVQKIKFSDLDLSKIEDIVKFFQRLLNERADSETPKV
jgi:hypothetical protein